MSIFVAAKEGNVPLLTQLIQQEADLNEQAVGFLSSFDLMQIEFSHAVKTWADFFVPHYQCRALVKPRSVLLSAKESYI